MRLVWLPLVLGIALALSAMPAIAEPDTPAKPVVALDFAHFGFKSTPAISDIACTVVMSLDRKIFLAHADEIKALGLLNENELPNAIDAMPDTLSMAFVLQTAPSVAEKLYRDNPGVDHCRFDQYLKVADENGMDQTLKIFSFDLDRALYEKIDWARLSSQSFVRVAHDFRFDREFQTILRVEAKRH